MRFLRNLGIAVLILALCAANVVALPPLPSSFWGVITMNGARIPQSAELTAHVEGVMCGRATIFLYMGTTYYSLSVRGDDPDTPEREGGREGDSIEFRLNGVPLATTAHWHGSTNVRLDMVESSAHRQTAPPRVVLPLVAVQFWPQLDGAH
ncbi:MAG: hypothetical protein H5T65_08490 [Chloroflexi bacterium]|nr:hypothetical protein [Chloroflexota bacterium]